MKIQFKRWFLGLLLVSTTPILYSCGEGVKGFEAPIGSSVTLSEDATVETNSDVTFIYTVIVTLPDGSPGNNIQVILSCEVCDLQDTDPAGNAATVTDLTGLTTQTNPYIIKTGSSGVYKIGVRVAAPANLGVTEYKAHLNADIGATVKKGTITVKSFGS